MKDKKLRKLLINEGYLFNSDEDNLYCNRPYITREEQARLANIVYAIIEILGLEIVEVPTVFGKTILQKKKKKP